MRTGKAASALVLSLLLIAATTTGCRDDAPSREELAAMYPGVEEASGVPENPKILCPFHRMLERAGVYDSGGDIEAAALDVPVDVVTDHSETFGCSQGTCRLFATLVASGQGQPGVVDLERLHAAEGISHDCGLTFDLGDTEVNDAHRQSTLDRLGELADLDGNLTFGDLMTVKLEICAAQGVEPSFIGEGEAKLIYAYLGGVENGSIALSDVDLFLHASMPQYKTHLWIDFTLLSGIE